MNESFAVQLWHLIVVVAPAALALLTFGWKVWRDLRSDFNGRLSAIDDAIKEESDRASASREKMYGKIDELGQRVSRVEGRLNGAV